MTVLLRKVRGQTAALLRVDAKMYRLVFDHDHGGGVLGAVLGPLMRWIPALALAAFVYLVVSFLFPQLVGGIGDLALIGMVPLGTAVQPQQDRRLPFRYGTRFRYGKIAAVPFVPGQPLAPIVLPQVGLVEKIILKLEGSVTFTGGGNHFDAFGVASMFKRITFELNNGTAQIVNVTGRGLELYNAIMSPEGAAPIVAQTAAAVNYGLVVPINANERDLLEFGLINLQAEQIRATLNIVPATAAEFDDGAGVDATSLTLHVYYKYWDIPDPTQFVLPPLSLVRLLEEGPIPIAQVGDQVYVVPRLGTLAQMAEYFINDGAPMQISSSAAGITPDLTRFVLRANKTDTWLDQETRLAEIEQAMFNNSDGGLGSFLREGAFVYDFFHSTQQERMMGNRDMIDTEQITTLESIVTVDSGVVLETASRNVVRRVFNKVVGPGGY